MTTENHYLGETMTAHDNWGCGGCGTCLGCVPQRPTGSTSVHTLQTAPELLARATGPATSTTAALRAAPRTGSHKALLLLAYYRADTLADAAAAERAGLAHTRSWWKRCSDLRRDGLIAQVGTTTVRGEQVMTCKITAAGAAMAAQLLGGAR